MEKGNANLEKGNANLEKKLEAMEKGNANLEKKLEAMEPMASISIDPWISMDIHGYPCPPRGVIGPPRGRPQGFGKTLRSGWLG